jgi:hypothetical protein
MRPISYKHVIICWFLIHLVRTSISAIAQSQRGFKLNLEQLGSSLVQTAISLGEIQGFFVFKAF